MINFVIVEGYINSKTVQKFKSKNGIVGYSFSLNSFRYEKESSKKFTKDYIMCRIYGKHAKNFYENINILVDNHIQVCGKVWSMKVGDVITNYINVTMLSPFNSILDLRFHNVSNQIKSIDEDEVDANLYGDAEDDCLQEEIVEQEELPL